MKKIQCSKTIKNCNQFTTKKLLSMASYGRGVKKKDEVSILISNFMHFICNKEKKYVTAFPTIVAYPSTSPNQCTKKC